MLLCCRSPTEFNVHISFLQLEWFKAKPSSAAETMSSVPPKNPFPPVLLPLASRCRRALSNHLSEASVATTVTEASVAPTLLDLDSEEADGEVTLEQDGVGIALPREALPPFPPVLPPLAPPLAPCPGPASTPRAARSRSPHRPPAALPQAKAVHIISPGRLPVLPVCAQPPRESELPRPVPEQTINVGEVPQDPFVEEPPWGDLMNGSVMDEPYVPPPQPRGPREPALLLVAPEPAELLPRHFSAIRGGASMLIGSALHAALVGVPHQANTTLRISSDSRGIEEGWRHASSRIRELDRSGVTYYIGITENPGHRWEERYQTAPWDDMEILIEAPSSCVTAELERRLIPLFLPVFGCTNVGGGGERRSGGHPHFLYVLVRQSGLLRRSY